MTDMSAVGWNGRFDDGRGGGDVLNFRRTTRACVSALAATPRHTQRVRYYDTNTWGHFFRSKYGLHALTHVTVGRRWKRLSRDPSCDRVMSTEGRLFRPCPTPVFVLRPSEKSKNLKALQVKIVFSAKQCSFMNVSIVRQENKFDLHRIKYGTSMLDESPCNRPRIND